MAVEQIAVVAVILSVAIAAKLESHRVADRTRYRAFEIVNAKIPDLDAHFGRQFLRRAFRNGIDRAGDGITKRPTQELTAEERVKVGNFGVHNFEGTISGPI